MTKQVLICDDDDLRAETWKAQIAESAPSGVVVSTLTGGDLVKAIDSLADRTRGEDRDCPSVFDGADVLIVDSDLSPDHATISRLGETVSEGLSGRVGDTVAYQARTFTDAGFLIVVNQGYSERTFDLSMRRFAGGIADLYLSERDLLSPYLWGAYPSGGEYRPWSWPSFAVAVAQRKRLKTFLEKSDEPLLARLNLDADSLAPDQLDVFGDVEPSSATARDIAVSTMGLKPKDLGVGATEANRMAGSVLYRWLDRYVVGTQNVVGDAAHLISRFPAAFGTLSLDQATVLARETRRGGLPRHLVSALSPVSDVLGRLVFSVSAVRELAAKRESVAPFRGVWAEDTSRFIDSEQAIEILTAFGGSMGRRYVEEVKGVRYLPKVRRL